MQTGHATPQQVSSELPLNPAVSADQIGGPFCQAIGCRHRIGRNQHRHDGGIDNAQSVNAMDAQRGRIDHGVIPVPIAQVPTG